MVRRPPVYKLPDALFPDTTLFRSLGRAAIAADLREAGQARLDRMAVPIAIVDIPEQRIFRPRPHGVRAGADDAHAAGQDIEELRNLVEAAAAERSEEHTSELQSLMRISYAVFCLKHKT